MTNDVKKKSRIPLIVSAILVCVGIAAWAVQVTQGMHVTALTGTYIWGLSVAVFYAMMACAAGLMALCGFSAGGHVAACVGTMWNRADVLTASGCTGEEGRPNALILGYPCITVDVEGQGDMYDLLKGDRTLEELRDIASAEQWVGPHTPPVFLWNMYHDKMVPVEHGLGFMEALAKQDIPFECHTYMKGNHACALASPASSLGDPVRENDHVARWLADCTAWLGEIFGTPALDVPQENMKSLAKVRAHLGIPAFKMTQGKD